MHDPLFGGIGSLLLLNENHMIGFRGWEEWVQMEYSIFPRIESSIN